MKTYGSFFSLELNKSLQTVQSENIKLLNTGRNAFEYILRIRKPSKVFLPSLSCEALYTPLKRLSIPFVFYNVDEKFEPIFDFSDIHKTEYFLYINYYGLKDNYINGLVSKVKNLILDNTQAFFSPIHKNIPTFNSLRKFFGVPDGSFLYNIDRSIELEKDYSAQRFQYLIKRLESPSNEVYQEYRKVEYELDNLEMKAMSDSTLKVFNTIPIMQIKTIRNTNFSHYNKYFGSINRILFNEFDAPHFYPLWIENGYILKKGLIKKGIFTATFWPNIFENSDTTELEKEMANEIIPLPIDQRYCKEDIMFIISEINRIII
jgi:hypothetical protein